MAAVLGIGYCFFLPISYNSHNSNMTYSSITAFSSRVSRISILLRSLEAFKPVILYMHSKACQSQKYLSYFELTPLLNLICIFIEVDMFLYY